MERKKGSEREGKRRRLIVQEFQAEERSCCMEEYGKEDREGAEHKRCLFAFLSNSRVPTSSTSADGSRAMKTLGESTEDELVSERDSQ